MGTVVPRSIGSQFDVVITGAGISIDPPAYLPSSADLVDEVWAALCSSLSGAIDAELDAERIRPQLTTMRMEQFLELLSGPGAIPVRILANVYRLVGGAAFNENHLRLASLDVKHFTLNMDTLIEDAGPGARVVHLHGVWSQPRSIRTTVDHYSKGLSKKIRRRFGRAIADRNVLVIGYSGRDTDVMPLLGDYLPKRMTWVGPNPGDWGPEVRALRNHYDSLNDPDFRFVAVDAVAGEFLPTLVPTVPRASGEKRPHSPLDLHHDLATGTTRAQRMIAVSRLLFGMGLNEDLRRILGEESFDGASEIHRRKLVSRSWSREGDYGRAYAILTHWPSSLAEALAWPGNLNEIAAIARRLSRPGIASWVQSLIVAASYVIPTRSMRRRRLLVLVRIAKTISVAGDHPKAARLLSRVTASRRVRYVLGDASLVDALTWEADVLKAVGQMAGARERVERALLSINYADHSQAAFALWKCAEIRLAAGRSELEDIAAFNLEIEELLARASAEATLARSSDALAWIYGTWAEYLVCVDVFEARSKLDSAANFGAARSDRSALGRGYHALQRAVVDTYEANFQAAAESASMALAIAEEFTVPALALQARELIAEIQWRDGSTTMDLAGQLEVLSAEYAALGMRLNQARTFASVASLRGKTLPPEFIRSARALGWNDVVRRSTGREGTYPWPWSILL